MSNKTDSNSYTVLFAIGMVLVVGALLAFTASSLRPMIDANKKIEKQQNILYAMGVNENEGTSVTFISKDQVKEVFKKHIEKQLVIEGDKISEDNEAFLIDVKKEQAAAKDGKVRRLPLFIGSKDGKMSYIAPIRGKGLWDAIWGYVAMDKNMVVQGVFFDHKGETPGLGANIKQRFFMDDFAGEDLMSNGQFKGIAVSKSNADPKNEDKTDNEVDAIAGATITGDGVAAMIKSELKLYVPYFKTLK
ncbi:Na(+)-translocating NADH-quinone reductase subunit C [uncultured Tenacibaculum sp.]|uniref:Na(+)-translocating NADH-quinone reductase subunit C n=1 Tax=uncultured Tenacibaculum sp. TaxID=174713 RepID=UPI00260FF453|nr:Na(+)-translocating NADH-quinone reductase subunit C [uncultured Tenacibaculum sp.]